MTDVAMNFRHYLQETNRFQSYLYSYPHKTAYRPFEQAVDLKALWSQEKKKAHIGF